MTDAPMEYTAEGRKSGQYDLEPGTWEVRGTKIVRVDAHADVDAAADKVSAALKKLLVALDG